MAVWKLKFNNKLLYRYLFSYTIILLLPVLIIGLMVYNFFIQLLENEVTKSNINLLTQVKDTVDVKMTELNNIAFNVATNSNLTPYNVTKNPYTEMNTIEHLRHYISANQFIDNLLLYFNGHNTLYSPYSTYDVHTFTDKIYSYPKWKPEQFIHDLQFNQYKTVRGAEPVSGTGRVAEKLVTYMTPIPPNNPTPYGTVVFLIKESALKSLLKKKFEDNWSHGFILDENNKLIASTNGTTEETARLVGASLPQGSANIGNSTRFSDRDYFVYNVRSDLLGWTFVSLVDQQTVLQDVERTKRRTFYGISLVLLLGGIVVFFTTQMSYKPIRTLQRFAESKANREFAGLGEFESIHSAINHISESNMELNKEISNSRPAMKHYVMLNLIRGQYSDIEDLNRRMMLAHIQLTKPYYLVSILHFPKSTPIHASDRSVLLNDLEQGFPENIEVYGMESVDGTNLIFIMGLDDPQIDEYKMNMLKVHRTVSDNWGCETTIGAGRIYSQINELGKSYIEACGAVDYRLIEGNGKVIFFDDIVPISDLPHVDYSKSEWNQLKLYMHQGDAERIEAHLEQIIQKIRERQLSLFLVKCMCFDLINVIFSMLSELQWESGELMRRYPDVVTLTEFETVEELILLVKHISADISGLVTDRKESGNTELIGKMMTYIDDHYSSNQLSLQHVADEFQMSPSYLSRYFKDQSGQTVTQYIQTLRMRRAKELLSSGADNLQEVADQVGYGSVSGFIRKFKEAEGITPGEYRAVNYKQTP